MEERTDGRNRKVSTDPSGRDIAEKPSTTRQIAEAAMIKTRKALQEAKLARDFRRFEWQDRLQRRAERLENQREQLW
jgi:hypothetical protein